MTIFIILLAVILLPTIIVRLIFEYRNRPWLFRKQIQHDKFGRLWFIKNKLNSFDSHYQGHIYFEPADKEIDVFFITEVDFDEQHTVFFKEIESRYHDLYPDCFRLLEDHFKIKLTDLYLDAIILINSSNLQHDWQLRYCSMANNLLNITVDFKDWKVQEIKN